MTRIKPESFVECWEHRESGTFNTAYPDDITNLQSELKDTHFGGHKTIALFLIKPTSIPLAERLEARGLNNPKP